MNKKSQNVEIGRDAVNDSVYFNKWEKAPENDKLTTQHGIVRMPFLLGTTWFSMYRYCYGIIAIERFAK